MTVLNAIGQCWQTQLRILTFRASRDELLNLGRNDFCWGLFWVWMAGIGRAWDDAQAAWVAKIGLPSIGYIFVLALFLWLVIAPLRPSNWCLGRLIIFISMTAMPAVLYAIPLEMMLPPADAANGNTYLLILVACWRVAMLGYYLFKTSDMFWLNTVTALLMPLFAIVNVLVMTESLAKTFAGMGGIRYVILVDPVEAKKSQDEAVKAQIIERDKTVQELKRKGEPIPAWALEPPVPYASYLTPVPDTTGRAKAQVYQEHNFVYEPVPNGYAEISWDDTRYLPPSPLMGFILPLKSIAWISFPILLAYYFLAAILVNFEVVKKPKTSEEP